MNLPLSLSANRHRRAGGVTLAEVLISMAVLTIGLLGASAMFPVGSYYMRKSEVADRGSAIAQAAFAELVARGDLNPENWLIWDTVSGASTSAYRTLGDTGRAWISQHGIADQASMNRDLGFVYIIDPLGDASAIANGLNHLQASLAPYGADLTGTEVVGSSTDLTGIANWQAFTQAWPVRRLCTERMVVNNNPIESIARNLYQSTDDVNFTVDDDNPTVARMVGDTTGDGFADTPVARQATGDYSWMAMITPTQSKARQALVLNPSAYYYDVSVVVFFKRPLRDLSLSERLVGGRVVSTGTGGGELLLTQLQNDVDSDGNLIAEPFSELKSGQWVMVSGPHPASTTSKPLFFTQWYKVLAVDEQQRDPVTDNRFQITNSVKQRIVGLRGPDWPWEAGAPVRVGLFPGAVAVHTKSMRIETLGEYNR